MFPLSNVRHCIDWDHDICGCSVAGLISAEYPTHEGWSSGPFCISQDFEMSLVSSGSVVRVGVLAAICWLSVLGLSGCGPSNAVEVSRARQVIDLQNRGIGFIENKQWAEADQALSQITTLLPENVKAARNLAVARVLSMLDRTSPYSESDNAEKFSEGLGRANAAVSAYQLLAAQHGRDEQAVAFLLAGKLAAFEDSSTRDRIGKGLEFLKQAIEYSGNRPEMWYALVMALESHRDYADGPELIESLQEASRLAPENLAIVTKLLEKQALGLNSRNAETRALSAGLAETLRRTEALIAPLNAAILKQNRVDVTDMIQKALTQAKPEDPGTLLRPAMITRNLLLPELTQQIDLRRIDLNLLEYLESDLVPSLGLSAKVRSQLFEQSLPTVVTGFRVADALPDVQEVTDIQVVDMDLDGYDDLVVMEDGRVRVYGRSGGTDVWKVILESPSGAAPARGMLLVDIDRDFDKAKLADVKSAIQLLDREGDRRTVPELAGENRWYDTDLDVITWNDAGVTVLRNERAVDGTRNLIEVAQTATASGVRLGVGADLEADGDLDLVFATPTGLTAWRNLDGTLFEVISEGLQGPLQGMRALRAVDWNRDMAMDIVGVTDEGRVGWLQNMLHGRFRWLDGPTVSEVAGNPSDLVVGEWNRDGRWDLLVCGSRGTCELLPSNNERMDVPAAESLGKDAAQRLVKADFDNDGYVDVAVITDGGLRLFRGLPLGKFENLSALAAFPDAKACRSVAAADLDQDGDLDLAIVNSSGRLKALINDGGNSNEWTEIVPRAIGEDSQFLSNRVNMHGTGAVLEVRSGPDWQAHVIDAPRMHLGLGKAKQADTIRIIWTDGIPQNLTNVSLLKTRLGILAPQILIGSCPYIYTWNGDSFEFFSDCLWAAPLGLIQATGDMAPTREWEYLLIPGRQLQPKDGNYVLQLTEELWEAAYFDEVRLIAVDHPASVSVFTNEKVGSPEMAAHRIHTVQNARLPRSVTDSRGRDLLPGLKAQDQDYVQAFEKRLVQGLTDEWTLEFDLGELATEQHPVPSQPRLILIGWVFPTDTSINEGLLQNPQLPAPTPPCIEVPQQDGTWKTVRPVIGFPSGKTKAMVLDLTDVVTADNSRFRIRSSMELYWDAAFFTINETEEPTVTQDCELRKADLHYRGFSKRVYAENALFRGGRAPEGYDYSSVITEPRWNELLGRFTRYGETSELLLQQDDRMVVMGPGDELTVQFAVPSQNVPDGWVRDFVLYNVGWDKDANLSTVYGQSAEPYPSRSMGQYPGDVDQQTPATEAYLDWLNRYQTREYPRFRFRDAVRLSR